MAIRKKRGKQPAKVNPNAQKCDICGAPEDYPVANEFMGNIEWICWNCYKIKKGAK